MDSLVQKNTPLKKNTAVQCVVYRQLISTYRSETPTKRISPFVISFHLLLVKIHFFIMKSDAINIGRSKNTLASDK